MTFVIDSLSRAGTESQLIALIRSLDRSRFEPSLILLDGHSELSQSLEPDNCSVMRLGVTKLFSKQALSAARTLRMAWRANKPDFVVSYFLDSSYVCLPIAKSLGIATVRVRNNLGYWQSVQHRLLGRLMRPLTDRVLTNSAEGRKELIHRDGMSPDRVTIIENGVDLDRFSKTNDIPLSPIRIGCVANLRPVKNIDGLIRAVARVPNVSLSIAGDGPQREELQRLIDELHVNHRVTLLGSVTDIPAFLASCSFVVLPSHSESLSNALLEAMAASRAVIATDVGANRRVLGETGVIIPPGDEDALVEAIRDLADDSDRMREMGRLARSRVEQQFSREQMVRQFEAFFEVPDRQLLTRAA